MGWPTRNIVWPALVVILLLQGCSVSEDSTNKNQSGTSQSKLAKPSEVPASKLDHTKTLKNGTSIPVSKTRLSQTVPNGLPVPPVPVANPLTREKVDLGRVLFFDRNLSHDRTVSCASCHKPEKFWTNGSQRGIGIGNKEGQRNVPTLSNVVYVKKLFWDGRSNSLEQQALQPLLNPHEMGMPDESSILSRLHENKKYHQLFQSAFENGITIQNMQRAFASYQRTLLSGDTPYDRYIAGDKNALSPAAIRGLRLFNRKAQCAPCHIPPLFTDETFHNLGVGMDQNKPDLGRFHVVKRDFAKGKFRTPSLRDVARTAPYMHDGSLATLADTIELYDQGGISNPNLHPDVRQKLRLTTREKKDLEAFLREGLTSNSLPDTRQPASQ